MSTADTEHRAPPASLTGEHEYRRIIETMPEPVAIANREGRVCFANAAARTLFGGPDGKLPDRPLGFPLRSGLVELCLRGDRGTVRQMQLTETEWEGGPAWIATFYDISDQTRAQVETDAFLSYSPALMYVRNADGRYTVVNPRLARSLDMVEEQIVGKSDTDLYDAAVAERLAENHRRVLETGASLTFEITTRQNGVERAYLCDEFPLRNAAGRVYAVGGIRTDITKRKTTEARLRESQAREQAILESSLDCVVMMDTSGRIEEFNAAAERTFGYDRAEVLGRPMTEMLIAPAVRDSFRDSLQRCLESGPERLFDQRVELTAVRKGGAEFTIETAVSIARFAGRPILTAVMHDVTERTRAHLELIRQTEDLQQAMGALERARERERQVLASIPLLFIGVDDNAKVTHWNPAATKQFNLPAGDVLGKALRDLPVRWPAEPLAEAISLCSRSGEPVKLDDFRVQDPNGRERILTLTINRIEATGSEGSGVVVIGTDITGSKAMETQLMLAQKMKSIGQLAAGIAHEINTPTQYVSDNTRFLRDAFKDFQQILNLYEALRATAQQGPVPAADIEQIDSAAQAVDLPFLIEEIPTAIEQSLEGLRRVAEIVSAMKQFSHPDQDEPELVDLNHAIQNTVTVARNEWKYVAEVELDLDPELPSVSCMVGRFNQVILNLVVNAAQAITDVVEDSAQEKGKIRVTTRADGDQVEIRVTDTGTGIPLRIRNRIFDPFFTTKQVGKGTGQGLAIAHNIVVEQHGGTIDFETEEGKGTTFILRLPLRQERHAVEDTP